MSYGPDNQKWREEMAAWVATYPYVARHCLRNERSGNEVVMLVGQVNADRIASAEHMPSFVALKISELLCEARERLGMDGFSFLQIDRERILLIDNYGGCERIVNTPLPKVFSIQIRHFITLYLLTLPLVLFHQMQTDWLVPLVTMLVAYPLLALDQIGIELENPFSKNNLSHLPIDDISATIERNIMGLLKLKETEAPLK